MDEKQIQIPNIRNYKMEIVDDVLILTPKPVNFLVQGKAIQLPDPEVPIQPLIDFDNESVATEATMPPEDVSSLDIDDISEAQLLQLNLTKSRIIECNIMDKNGKVISEHKNKYTTIMLDIWKKMDRNDVISNSKISIKPLILNQKGYKWIQDLRFAYQRNDATKTLHEIINMVNFNLHYIYIKIKLSDGQVVRYMT